MTEPHPDSTLETRVRRGVRGGRRVVDKRAAIHIAMEDYGPERLAGAVAAYQEQLEGAGVPVPELIEVGVAEMGVRILQADAGAPVLASPGAVDAFLDDTALIDAILAVLRRARIAGVWLDPHPKNFVRTGAENPTFVDLWQPVGVASYRSARLAAASPSSRDFVEACLGVFAPDRLVLHFVGDVLGMAPEADAWAAGVLGRAGLTGAGTVAEQVAEARRIRALEDRRLKLGIHLV